MALTQRTHELIRAHFSDKRAILTSGIAIDATCGNGHDTEFLCRLGFDTVFGFDVQAAAINATKEHLDQTQLKATLIQSGHETIDNHVSAQIDCAMFNFGYLPSADKNITTTTNTSIKALKIVTNKLSQNGLVTLMCYPGHPEGAIETDAIKAWMAQLNTDWKIETHLAKSPKPTAPILFKITKTAI